MCNILHYFKEKQTNNKRKVICIFNRIMQENSLILQYNIIHAAAVKISCNFFNVFNL